MFYQIVKQGKDQDYIKVAPIDDLNDDELWNVADIICYLCKGNKIYFEWCRESYILTEEEYLRCFECLTKCFFLDNLSNIKYKNINKLYVGYMDDNNIKSKEAIFYAWRGMSDSSFFTSPLSYQTIVSEYYRNNKSIVFSINELKNIIKANNIFFRTDTGDELIIYSKDLPNIERMLIQIGIPKK